MHWLVPSAEAKTTKSRLENLGLKPNLYSLRGIIHIYVPGVTEPPIEGASFESCEICLAADTTPAQPGKSRYKYSVYPPLVLFSSPVPISDAQVILDREKCTHAAINRPIPNLDIVRRPQIEPLIGNFGEYAPEALDFDKAFWCTCRQNGIFQTWAPLHTMFSRGNVTEKKRVLEFCDIRDSTVIDLYCGIGYFTFSYAKNSPKVVYGWEINPWSIEGLSRAAKANKWNCRIIQQNEYYLRLPTDQLVIFAEDNVRALERIHELDLASVSHINMGLLPDCRLAWHVAQQLATKETIFHVHENVHENDMDEWKSETAQQMGPLIHLEKIKRFSPAVWHVCGDFKYISPELS